MPLYLYTCICGEFTDISHPMNYEPEILCKTCYAVMRKKPSVGSIHFKGEGFASNDNTSKRDAIEARRPHNR